MKIVIIGTGPTGLGSAWRLTELDYDNFKVFEKSSHPGGLAASFTDNGFTWDIGGHVLFSHYKYFDELMDSLLKDEWVDHERESWIWLKNRFIPYPFQNNIRLLPKEDFLKCLNGLIKIQQTPFKPINFREWILANFGKGIAELFLYPYNYKVWAYRPEKMSYKWIGERVAITDPKEIVQNIRLNKDDTSWGPNRKFRFPLKGGTGEIWRRLYNRLDKKKVFFDHEIVEIDSKNKILKFSNGKIENYVVLINSMPLDKLTKIAGLRIPKLLHSSVHIFGLGLEGKPPSYLKTKCWMYFPEDNCPFYRVTVFSNYSPNNAPKNHWSLMLEVSESPNKKISKNIKEEVIQGALNTKLIKSREQIKYYWHHFEEYGYPTPSLERDNALKILKKLEKLNIYSRGRFGAWKYEVGNMDHSLMQGVEIINRLINNEEEVTVWKPGVINSN